MQIGFELTHHCNLSHPKCDHRIAGSDYELTKEDFEQALSWLDPLEDDVILVGGEPTYHPLFDTFARRLVDGGFRVQVKTNGFNLPPDLVDKMDIILQHYPGENDEKVLYWGSNPSVRVRAFSGWYDPDRDPMLSDEDAMILRNKCGAVELRVFGQRLYGCCISEAIERHFQTGPAHVEMNPDWRDWTKIPTWRTCARCFRAIDKGLANDARK